MDAGTARDFIEDLREDNTRAWQRVAELEAQLKECSAERNRLSQELARTYE
jgi:septal ring factor EnvC (AmiA/AmiB activator)